MSGKVEYYEESDEENEHIAVEQLEPGEYYDEEIIEAEEGEVVAEIQEKPVFVAVRRNPGTVILKPGTITLPVAKKKLTPIHDKQAVKEVLDKYKTLGTIQRSAQTIVKKVGMTAESPNKRGNIEILNDDSMNADTGNTSLTGSSSLRDRFMHRKSNNLICNY